VAVGGAVAGRRRPRLPFRIAMAVAAAGVALLVWRGSSLG